MFDATKYPGPHFHLKPRNAEFLLCASRLPRQLRRRTKNIPIPGPHFHLGQRSDNDVLFFSLFYPTLSLFICLPLYEGDETSVLTNQILIITIISGLISCYVYPSVSPNHLCHSSSSPFSLHFLPFLPFLLYLALPPFTSHIITRVPSFLCIPLLLYLRPILH